MGALPARLVRRVRAIAADRPWLSPHAHRLMLVAYYLAVLIALVLMYGINPPSPPPFIYQGF